jgi:UDP-galactopyranose mutase
VNVVTPVMPESSDRRGTTKTIQVLLRRLMAEEDIEEHIAWYYTPMAMEFSDGLAPAATVYDCMDELSLFRHAPPELRINEKKLFAQADLVFTGGISLFEAKRRQHEHVFAFSSSVDCDHFAKARALRNSGADAEDQRKIPHPRLGYAGVIDERIDVELIGEIAQRRPDWQIVMIGPVVKIDPASLPRHSNIHWLGMKDYSSLPEYLAGWDAALMPFALNDSTKYISPTKTPEYLAAGLHVISTPIRDVERQYGELGLVRIEADPAGFVAAVDEALTYQRGFKWRERVDGFLQTLSWDKTWTAMNGLIEEVLASRAPERPAVMTAS